MTNRVVFFVFCLALLALVACRSGQAKPSLKIIEVEERTSMMNGSFLDPLGEALRKSGNVMSPEDALAAAKGGAFGLDAAPLEYPQELRFILGTFFFEPGVGPALAALGPDARLGHAFYTISSDRRITCAPAGGGSIAAPGTPPPPHPTPGTCRWEVTVDATTGEVLGMTVAPTCPEFPLPRTCR
ncbi:MAG: hypothetical protein AB7U95_39220 [Reyranella sp.]